MVVVEPAAWLAHDLFHLTGGLTLDQARRALAEPLVDLIGRLVQTDGELALRRELGPEQSEVFQANFVNGLHPAKVAAC